MTVYQFLQYLPGPEKIENIESRLMFNVLYKFWQRALAKRNHEGPTKVAILEMNTSEIGGILVKCKSISLAAHGSPKP